jgi:hypothetical protein
VITASPNPKITFSSDATAGAKSSTMFLQCFNNVLLQVFGPPQVYSSVADCYTTFTQAAVPAFLVCTQILWANKTTWLKPLLMIMSCPMAFCKRFTSMQTSEMDANNCVLLQPAGIPPPLAETFMVLGSVEQDLCDCNLFPLEDWSPSQYLEESVVVCFSKGGTLFSSVMVSPVTTHNTRDLAFTMDEYCCLHHLFWVKLNELHETKHDEDTWLLHNQMPFGACLPKFLPLPIPL